jgi:hypothetical protein
VRITFDAATKRWVNVSTGSLGDYDFMVSNGWKDQRIVRPSLAFVKDRDAASQADLTITKVSPTHMRYAYGFTTPRGKSVTVTRNCSK